MPGRDFPRIFSHYERGELRLDELVTRTYRQTASPPELLSRVMATVRFVSWGAIPIGGLVAGALAGLLSGRAALLVFVLAAACIPLVLLASPIRHLRDLDDYRDTADDPSPSILDRGTVTAVQG